MNVSWVFAVALALAGAANAGPISDSRVHERSEELHDVWNKFANLVPRKEFQRILEDYLVHDSGFNSAVEFFFSDACREAFRKIDSIDDVVRLYDYLEEAGLDAYQIVNELHVVVGLPPLSPRREARSAKITGGSAGFIADYKAILPLDKIQALYEDQVKSSPAFARFVEYWKSPRFREIIEALRANEEFQKQLEVVNEGGIHLWDIADLYATMFSLELPGRKIAKRSLDLDADLKEFRALVPEEEIMELYREYMQADPEAMYAYAYLRTVEYRDLIEKINSIDDVKRVYDYLQEAGLDARALVNLLSPQKLRRNSRSVKITGGPAGYIADIKAILPVDKIQALHEEKLKTSPAFAKFVEHWKSPRFQKLLEALHSNREFQESIKIVKDAGVDLVAIADLYFSSLGLQLPFNRRAVRSADDDSLASVMDEFGALLPTIERGKMLEDYLLTDEEFNRGVLYLSSPAFTKVVEKAEKIEDVKNVYDYLEDAGLPIHKLVNNLHDVVGLPHLKPKRQSRSAGITGGASGFVADYKALLPLDKIRALHEEKLKTSPAFARFVGLWKSPRFQELIDALRANREFQELIEAAKEGGVDVIAFADFYATALGLELRGSRVAKKSVAKRTVGDVGFVLIEFLNLVPAAEYNAMMREYLKNDKGVQAALQFFVHDGFKKILEKVDSIKDVISLYDYLEEAGLEVYSMLNSLHAMVDLPPLKPGRSTRSVKITGGTSGLIADYKAILPIDKIKALHEERLKTSPAFARFVGYMKSPRFQEIIEALRANEELQEQLKLAKEGGIDVAAIADLFATMIGLELPFSFVAEKSVAKRSVEDVGFVLIEFLNLVPTEEYNAMMREYLKNDNGLQAALQFFLSDAFKGVLEKVDNMKDVISLYDYLEEAGLEVYTMLNDLHTMVDLPPLKPGRSTRSVRITGGTSGLIADYKAILPIDKIKALHEERLKTSPAFARFVRYLKSPRFQKIIEALRANEELQEQLKIAKEGGIDVVAIADLYATAVGVELPISRVAKRSVDDLDVVLREFLNLVPQKEYNALLKAYLENDEGLQDDLRFFLSDSFKDAFEKIENTEDVIGLYDYLEEAGLEIYTVLKDLHIMTGLPPPKHGRSTRSVRITGGASGLIADYKAILPIDKIKALHEERLKTSPAFARFVGYLKSPRFHKIIEALRANEELQKQLKIAKEGGIDFLAIADLGATLIGLELPKVVAKRSADDLQEDLQKFNNLMPRKKLRKILDEYLTHDEGFNDAVEFLFSDAFKDALRKAESLDDLKNFYDYLEEAGLDAYDTMNIVHLLLGLPPVTKKSERHVRSVTITGGLDGYIADFRALLPGDKIKALHKKLVETSPAFARLVEYWKAPRFLELIEALRANEEFQKQLKIVKDGGVDLRAIADLYASKVGLEFPEVMRV